MQRPALTGGAAMPPPCGGGSLCAVRPPGRPGGCAIFAAGAGSSVVRWFAESAFSLHRYQLGSSTWRSKASPPPGACAPARKRVSGAPGPSGLQATCAAHTRGYITRNIQPTVPRILNKIPNKEPPPAGGGIGRCVSLCLNPPCEACRIEQPSEVLRL